jgi:hypothetical protein
VPQAPQFRKFACVSTQTPLQSDVPTSQAHLPAEQICPDGQAASQAPQLLASLLVSTQAAPHCMSACPQETSHLPELQTSSLPQAVAQSPQCVGELLVSTQLALQLVSPAGHTQPAAPEQSSLTAQAVAQSPQ